MKKELKGELTIDERFIADAVAEEIIEQDDKEKKRFLIFLLIFIICLIFLISSISFAMFGHHHSGSHDNVIDTGSVLFSFNEGSNYIEILNAYPISDQIGKNYSGDKQYFDFSVSVGFSKKVKNKNLNYEVSLIPLNNNTLDDKYIRVYLTKNGKDISINEKIVNNFSDLDKSIKYKNGKVLITENVKKNTINNYRLRLWLSDKYEVTNKSLVFKCKVAIATYEE